MSRWWRAYDEAVDDPKLLLLSDRAHRAWFNLMCLTSIGRGRLPEIKVIELKLRLSRAKVQSVLKELIDAGLIDKTSDGLAPHNWDGRQYKSDVTDPTNAARQKKFRNKHRNAVTTVTDAVTDKRPETEEQNTEAETEKEPSQFPSPIESINLSIGEAKRDASPPRHCAQSRQKDRVYVVKGTPEWDAYAADFRAARGEEPQINSDGGRWFLTQGEASHVKQS